jgi:hypothetical protein
MLFLSLLLLIGRFWCGLLLLFLGYFLHPWRCIITVVV